MQAKKLSVLCALACAGFAGQAVAGLSDPAKTIVDDANANGRVIYIAGASAVQKGFQGIVAKLFDTSSGTSIVWFGSAKDTTGADYFAVAGKLADTTPNGTGLGDWAGQNVIIIERVVGGSVYGVNSVERAESINALKVTSADCGLAGSGTGADNKNAIICNVGTNNMVPDAGVSDVAPKFFQNPYNTEGEPAAAQLGDDELADLAATPIYGLAFGPAVTTNLPSSRLALNKAGVASLMAGNYGLWKEYTGDAADASDPVVVCRRTPGSGTQAVFNMYFGGFACYGTFNVPADRDSGKAWNGSAYVVTASANKLQVIENASSGDVKKCLNAAANADTADQTYSTKDRNGNAVSVTFKKKTGGYKAVGTLSMDSLNESTTTSKWTFRNLDGKGQITWNGDAATDPVVTGSGKNATVSMDGLSGSYIDGTWDLQAWESFNIPSRTVSPKLDVLNAFLDVAKDPSVHAAVTNLKFVTAGIPGGDYSGARVLQAGYLGVPPDQCAPYNKQ